MAAAGLPPLPPQPKNPDPRAWGKFTKRARLVQISEEKFSFRGKVQHIVKRIGHVPVSHFLVPRFPSKSGLIHKHKHKRTFTPKRRR
jgi:hypothetical protein